MLRSILRVRCSPVTFVQSCSVGGEVEKTRKIISDVEHIIQPHEPPPPELTGHLRERWEPAIMQDSKGRNITPLGASRAVIATLQEPASVEPQNIRYNMRVSKMRILREDQAYSEKALDMLGPDLLAAHFLVARGAKVFFTNGQWFSEDRNRNVLNAYRKKDDPKIEAVDASDCSIVYEGFDYLRGLDEMKYLDLSYNHRLDDHCLHKISLHLQTLEYLNLSHCPNISERGLATLHSMYNLKRLVVNNVQGVNLKQMICLQLEESIPGLLVEGVSYNINTIDKEIEEDAKKYEKRYQLSESVDYVDKYLIKQSRSMQFMEKLMTYLPKSSEKGLLAKFLGVKAPGELLERAKHDF